MWDLKGLPGMLLQSVTYQGTCLWRYTPAAPLVLPAELPNVLVYEGSCQAALWLL